MTAHPNRSRSRNAPGRNPKPAEIAQLREEMELTQAEFGALVYRARDTVQAWETDRGDGVGERRCPALTWEYLCLLHAFPQVARYRQMWLEGRAP
jgi:DNA-binding XRE family transcriptional regulator